MTHWSRESIFYHIYPLGFCGAPFNNDFSSPPVPRLDKISAWLDHIQQLGANAIYLGPVFESSTHGYDTVDYYWVDRRLGTNETLANLSREIHRRDMRLVLDGVFNHVGRDFWAFFDVRRSGASSAYTGWFSQLSFQGRSPYGDPFTYEGWNGHYSLVRLNRSNPAVKEHLFEAIAAWVRDFNIDGLRLDAADCLELDFLKDLAGYCRGLRSDFWLVGEIIHGDYRRWANSEMLDSVTNYECYKGLYSSHASRNYYEIAYAFNRQFGPEGIYQDLPLYAFADNHDVNRVASNLDEPAHLFPLYLLLMTMPGIPSIYYGSEWGIEGRRTPDSDRVLRPDLDLLDIPHHAPHPELAEWIARLASVRRSSPALRLGSYKQLYVSHQQLAFLRQYENEPVVVMVNASTQPAELDLSLSMAEGMQLVDRLSPGERFTLQGGRLRLTLPACGGRILLKAG